jgi:hypothetical protein
LREKKSVINTMIGLYTLSLSRMPFFPTRTERRFRAS